MARSSEARRVKAVKVHTQEPALGPHSSSWGPHEGHTGFWAPTQSHRLLGPLHRDLRAPHWLLGLYVGSCAGCPQHRLLGLQVQASSLGPTQGPQSAWGTHVGSWCPSMVSAALQPHANSWDPQIKILQTRCEDRVGPPRSVGPLGTSHLNCTFGQVLIYILYWSDHALLHFHPSWRHTASSSLYFYSNTFFTLKLQTNWHKQTVAGNCGEITPFTRQYKPRGISIL